MWDHIPAEAIKLLNKIHLTFLRTKVTTPIPSLYWETGSLNIVKRVHLKKLTFYHHLLNMDKSTLARRFVDIQIQNNFPGLMAECKELLRKYNLSEIDTCDYSKHSWKRKVKSTIVTQFENDLLEEMKGYKKIDHVKKSKEVFELKSYLKNMNLEQGRRKFAIETQMVDTIKFNFMSNKEYEQSNWACDYCLEHKKIYKPDSMKHVSECENYSQLRQGLNMDQDNDMVNYFIKVVKFRNNLTI